MFTFADVNSSFCSWSVHRVRVMGPCRATAARENQRPPRSEEMGLKGENHRSRQRVMGGKIHFKSVCFTNFPSYLCSLFAGSSIPIPLLGCFIWIFISYVNHCIFGPQVGVLWLRGDVYPTGSDLISCLETSTENKMSWGWFFSFFFFLKTAGL